jgi:hypothetical protein
LGGADFLRFDVAGTATTRSRDRGLRSPALAAWRRSGGHGGGADDPRLIELTVHQALARADDPRAAEWLTRAHSALMAQADAINRHSPDATLRQGFLHHIPHHREIVAAWAVQSA